MDLKVSLAVFVIAVLSFQSANSLKCYDCHSTKAEGGFCFDPIDQAKVPEKPCNPSNTRIDDEVLRAGIDRDLLERAENSTQYTCVVFEQIVIGAARNTSEMVRNCFLKLNGTDTCNVIKMAGAITSKEVLNCKTCDGDLCNGSPKPGGEGDGDSGTSLQVSLFVCLISFVLAALFK